MRQQPLFDYFLTAAKSKGSLCVRSFRCRLHESLHRTYTGALKDIVNGTYPDGEARAKYRELEKSYKDLSTRKAPSRGDSLPGLCYCHNIENFSLYTGIFLVKDNIVSRIASYGIDDIDGVVSGLLQSQCETLFAKQYKEIAPSRQTNLKQALHLYVFESSEKSLGVIISLSSSPYFHKKRFIYFGNFLETLFPGNAPESAWDIRRVPLHRKTG